jgi:hypothetical protein
MSGTCPLSKKLQSEDQDLDGAGLPNWGVSDVDRKYYLINKLPSPLHT